MIADKYSWFLDNLRGAFPDLGASLSHYQGNKSLSFVDQVCITSLILNLIPTSLDDQSVTFSGLGTIRKSSMYGSRDANISSIRALP